MWRRVRFTKVVEVRIGIAGQLGDDIEEIDILHVRPELDTARRVAHLAQ